MNYLNPTIERILAKVDFFGYDSAQQAAYNLLADRTRWTLLYDLTELRPWEVRELWNFTNPRQKPTMKLRVKGALTFENTVEHVIGVGRILGYDIVAHTPHYNLAMKHVMNHILIAGTVKPRTRFTKEQMN